MNKYDYSPDSFYLTVKDEGAHTLSSKAIEEADTSSLIENLLNEFQHSSDEEKNRYRPILAVWFSSLDESILYQDDERKVRDLIYEMF